MHSVLSNFALSFSIISVFMGVTITYNTGLRYGGPVSMTLGWLVVSALNGCVALSMAEICSAYPTSGGLYYWSAKLAGKDLAPFASWLTGWYVTSVHIFCCLWQHYIHFLCVTLGLQYILVGFTRICATDHFVPIIIATPSVSNYKSF
jgi:amino acid transporter